MIKTLTFLGVLAFTALASAQVEDASDVQNYLIYNCEGKHWDCVVRSESESCETQRKEDLEAKKKILGCAAIGSFPTKYSCYQRQLFLVSQNYSPRVCLADEWKQREMH